MFDLTIWVLISDFYLLFRKFGPAPFIDILGGGVSVRVCICVQKFNYQILFILLENQLPFSIRWQTASLSRPELNQW